MSSIQKELADKLVISDKAVSKWERGISYPDITLLEPLSLILGVSITELVQGRKIDMDEKENNVEKMMQETLDIGNEQCFTMQKKLLRLRIITIFSFVLLAALECVLLFLFGVDMEKASIHMWTVLRYLFQWKRRQRGLLRCSRECLVICPVINLDYSTYKCYITPRYNIFA